MGTIFASCPVGELSELRGGMRWLMGTSSDDVVDTRGGSMRILGLIATFDINGNLSGAHEA